MNKNLSQLNKTPIKLSPSDLTFLFDDCKRCFYEKVKNDFDDPKKIIDITDSLTIFQSFLPKSAKSDGA